MEKDTSPALSASGATGRVGVFASAASRTRLTTALRRFGYRVFESDGRRELEEYLNEAEEAIVLFKELESAEERALGRLKEFVASAAPVPVVAVSRSADPDHIVRAVTMGAASYLVSPFRRSSLRRAIEAAVDVGRRKRDAAKPISLGLGSEPEAFVRSSPQMKHLEETIRRVGDSDITILLRGESGVGKEVIARYIHRISSRAAKPFMKVNCAALPEELLESELFGYERGAFTGAVSQRAGKFEAAHGGTIFLDEITETSGRLQAKLLHVLQDKAFCRVGGTREFHADVRVIAATNSDLEQAVSDSLFREDLYFRLKIIELVIPPLRERPEEIPLLIEHFVSRFGAQYKREVPNLSPKLVELLLGHRWAGNVRELENMMKRLVILGEEQTIVQEILSSAPAPQRVGANAELGPPTGTFRMPNAYAGATDFFIEEGASLKEVGERAAMAAEKALIIRTLERTRWNRTQSAKLLGVSYKTLLTKMKKCGLSEG